MDHVERVAAILRANRFVALGTADADGPWTAPAQYRLLAGRGLYVESHASSRHVRAIAASGVASGAVYDSRAEPSEADGVQLSAVAAVMPRARTTIDGVLARRLEARPEGDLLARADMHLVELTVTGLWVFDRDSWVQRGRDDRVAVDPVAVWAVLER